MRRLSLLVLCMLFMAAGCGRVKTYTYQEKRADQDLSQGNRGMVMGETPAGKDGRKLTRTMAGVDIILPDTKEYKARKGESPSRTVVLGEPVTTKAAEEYLPDMEREEETGGFADGQWVKKTKMPAEDIVYKVQKDDTFEKIAKKFLGKASLWPELYAANRDTVKDPARIYPGQTIIIPGSLLEAEDGDIK